MIDKIWLEWQRANPANFWSFTGGSIATLGLEAPVTYKQYSEFPNGLPPMRNVSSFCLVSVKYMLIGPCPSAEFGFAR